MDSLGIVLVHGYTGGPKDLALLARQLCHVFDNKAVTTVRLPRHGGDLIPPFDADACEATIAEAIDDQNQKGRLPVIVGHSTGGSLVLGCLQKQRTEPAMLVLAGTPARIQGDDLDRWEHHRRLQSVLPLGDIARMVSYINRVGKDNFAQEFPVLLLSGSDDALVLPVHLDMWRSRFQGPVRKVIVHGAAHHLFTGPAGKVAVDCVTRALTNAAKPPSPSHRATINHLCTIEPGVAGFAAAPASRIRHLASTPSAMIASNQTVDYKSSVDADPIQLNIEITTRCNLKCRYCARKHRPRAEQDMALNTFEYLLDLMPDSYKVVLVGLGEPTLHPQVAEFVALAAERGHVVGMVTNAMALDRPLSRQLIEAGLSSIAFSLDSVESKTISQVRCGSDLVRIRDHIAAFLNVAEGRIPSSVFSAVSSQTVDGLPSLADAISEMGVTAWMLSDLNFQANLYKSLWKGWRQRYGEFIGRALQKAFSRRLPVMTVQGLEALGLGSRYRDYLLTSLAELSRRSQTHRWCHSPWQTMPIDVEGTVSLCDCQPDRVVGNLIAEGVGPIWNGRAMQLHRQAMRSKAPPEACRICPRF